MTPGMQQIIAALLTGGGSILGGLFGQDMPEGQKNEPYKGSISGPNTMHQLQGLLEGLGPVFTERLRRGVQLPTAYAQQPPVMAGGGLPMPIGVTGRDPALDNKSLLEMPGFLTGEASFASPGSQGANTPGTRSPQGPDAESKYTGRYAIPRRDLPLSDPRANPDDNAEALAALRLMGLVK